ncbi:MAG: PIN domain-containing protein [Acidobacteria bacterium]|nr:MAG: PIN domain-containing protein [Acidobacteriota bacterium]
MTLIDANILIYAYDASSLFHPQAKLWLEDRLSRPEPVLLAWTVVLAFLRITTDGRILGSPLARERAMAIVGEWLAWPRVRVVAPGPQHWQVFAQLVEQGGAKGRLLMDAHLAALAIEQGAELASCDKDFARFAQLRWVNPLEQAGWVHDG